MPQAIRAGKGTNQHAVKGGPGDPSFKADEVRSIARAMSESLHCDALAAVQSKQHLERAQTEATTKLADLAERERSGARVRLWDRVKPRPQPDVVDLRDGSLSGISTTEVKVRYETDVRMLQNEQSAACVQVWDEPRMEWRDRYPEECPSLGEHQDSMDRIRSVHGDAIRCLDEMGVRRRRGETVASEAASAAGFGQDGISPLTAGGLPRRAVPAR